MEGTFALIAVLVIASLGIILAIRLLGLLGHVVGAKPPAWMISNDFFGVPSRFLGGLIVLAFAYFIAAFFFDLPFFDFFDPAKGAAQ